MTRVFEDIESMDLGGFYRMVYLLLPEKDRATLREKHFRVLLRS